MLLLWENVLIWIFSKFKTTHQVPINHEHIYRSNYQTNTIQSDQKGHSLFPEGKQAWNPEGMNVNTKAHLAQSSE